LYWLYYAYDIFRIQAVRFSSNDAAFFHSIVVYFHRSYTHHVIIGIFSGEAILQFRLSRRSRVSLLRTFRCQSRLSSRLSIWLADVSHFFHHSSIIDYCLIISFHDDWFSPIITRVTAWFPSIDWFLHIVFHFFVDWYYHFITITSQIYFIDYSPTYCFHQRLRGCRRSRLFFQLHAGQLMFSPAIRCLLKISCQAAAFRWLQRQLSLKLISFSASPRLLRRQPRAVAAEALRRAAFIFTRHFRGRRRCRCEVSQADSLCFAFAATLIDYHWIFHYYHISHWYTGFITPFSLIVIRRWLITLMISLLDITH